MYLCAKKLVNVQVMWPVNTRYKFVLLVVFQCWCPATCIIVTAVQNVVLLHGLYRCMTESIFIEDTHKTHEPHPSIYSLFHLRTLILLCCRWSFAWMQFPPPIKLFTNKTAICRGTQANTKIICLASLTFRSFRPCLIGNSSLPLFIPLLVWFIFYACCAVADPSLVCMQFSPPVKFANKTAICEETQVNTKIICLASVILLFDPFFACV